MISFTLNCLKKTYCCGSECGNATLWFSPSGLSLQLGLLQSLDSSWTTSLLHHLRPTCVNIRKRERETLTQWATCFARAWDVRILVEPNGNFKFTERRDFHYTSLNFAREVFPEKNGFNYFRFCNKSVPRNSIYEPSTFKID